MRTSLVSAERPRRAVLSACLATALEAVCSASTAHTHVVAAQDHLVTSCLDDGSPGTLRSVLQDPAVASGDSINLSELTCSTITLSAPLKINRDALQLNGPTGSPLTIDGNAAGEVIQHFGYGELALSRLTIANGHYVSATAPTGGCIWSRGSVYLKDSAVSSCVLIGMSSDALGGGVYALHDLTLLRSTISHSYAVSTASAYGGGAFVLGDFHATASTIEGNAAASFGSGFGAGGGLSAGGIVDIDSSTISGNGANYVGAIRLSGPMQQAVSTITNSTISGNVSERGWGGIWSNAPLKVASTTIAFNSSGAANALRADGLQAGATLTLQNSLVADNTNASGPADLGATAATPIAGSNNLVYKATTGTQLPADTSGSCPHLDPLLKTAGVTATHVPRQVSAAVDQGAANAPATDQRGQPRPSGAASDIGAVERQPGDRDERILSNSFEGPCDV